MNAIKNKVQLIGHVGNDPEIKSFEDGKKVAKISLATNESYQNAKGEKVDETQWHQLVAWGKLADLAEKFLKKGSECAVEGKLMYRDYTDAKGMKRYITEVQLNEILFLDKKGT